ncbi:hypothetical protein CVT24_009844, partial [Panaeolus cyanescens]
MSKAIDTIIVPTILTTGNLHFAEIPEDGTVQNVIDTLLQIDGLKEEMLRDLEDVGWALQMIRVEHSGRIWEEEDLNKLGDGTLDPTAPVAPVLKRLNRESKPVERHFSSFPMTGHLHNPAFRLVSKSPALSLNLSFARVPEIHEEFRYTVYISHTMTVKDAITLVMDELGLAKSLPIPGAGNLEYVIEEVWVDNSSEKPSRLPSSTVIFDVLHFPYSPNPFKSTARRIFRLCVPDEWYRRSKTRSVSSPIGPSQDTIRRLAALQESEDEDGEDDEEEEGTAKMTKKQADAPSSTSTQKLDQQRGVVTQVRLSNMFEGWFGATSPSPSNRNSVAHTPEKRKSVSDPKLVEKSINDISDKSSGEESGDDEFDSAFDNMLDEIGLKGEKRSAMYKMPLQQKKYLLRQHRDFKGSGSPSSPDRNQTAYAASYGPSSGSALLPRLIPQLTGDSGLMRRLSIVGWGSGYSTGPVVASDSSNTAEINSPISTPGKVQAHVSKLAEDMPPIQPQSTGGIWSSLWALSGGERSSHLENGSKEATKAARWYIDNLKQSRSMDIKLIKHLISLRVHLSTAKLGFIEEFVHHEQGLEILSGLLSKLVGKGGKRKTLTDVESTVLLEVVKCLRVLLNTEVGFNQVLASPLVINQLSYALHIPSVKLHTLVCELLAAICVLSTVDGHKAVLSAFSDFRIIFEEDFRFQTLLASLRLPEVDIDNDSDSINGFGNDEDGVWEARVASMTLINALTNCPEDLEERVMLREELTRRGFNEIIVALRYIKPPDSLTNQLNLYTEEKFEDEEDVRDRARDIMHSLRGDQIRSRSDSEVALQDLIALAKRHDELYPTMVDILKHYGQILQSDIGLQLKADLFIIFDRFVEQAAMIDSFDDSWRVFLKRFATSVQHITGQEVEVKPANESDALEVVEQELEALRVKVEELSDERTELRKELNQQMAEMNALKSLPLGIPVPSSNAPRKAGSEQNFHGLVQRLVQKEKQVLQLQTELDKLKGENFVEAREADERAKRERDRVKWNTLMEEISKNKAKIIDLEGSLGMKEKEIVYLKRALESVYTRFMSREEARDGFKAAEMDAELIANRAIERLGQKESQISSLNSQILELKAQLAAKPKNEQEFKAKKSPPPPPPPVRPKKLSTDVLTMFSTPETIPPP